MDPERAAKFYRELFGWEISRWGNPAGAGEGPEYWMVRTVPTDAKGQPTRPGVNGGNKFAILPNHAGAPRTPPGIGAPKNMRMCCAPEERTTTTSKSEVEGLA